MKKLLILAFLLTSFSCSAAITGPFPIGPGVPPLTDAVAQVDRIQVQLYPDFNCSITVRQFVSKTAFAAGQAVNSNGMGSVYMCGMDYAQFKAYILDPIASGTIRTYEEGMELFLIRPPVSTVVQKTVVTPGAVTVVDGVEVKASDTTSIVDETVVTPGGPLAGWTVLP